jgi:hypothetical protein
MLTPSKLSRLLTRVVLCGVTVMNVSVGAATVIVTVTVVVIAPLVAVITAVPGSKPETRPMVPRALLTEATSGLLDVKVVNAVTSRVDPSLNVPVAVNCCELRSDIDGLLGVNAMDVSVAGLIVTLIVVVCPVNSVAVIVADPGATPDMTPVDDTVATLGLLVDQEADAVTSTVRAFVNVTVAVNCWVDPAATLAFVGVRAMETIVPAETVTLAEFETPPTLAVTLTGPATNADSSPDEPTALLMDATVPFDVVQVATVVRSWVVLSLYVPIATTWSVRPAAIVAAVGVTAIDVRTAGVTVSPTVPVTPAIVAEIVEVPWETPDASPSCPSELLTVATLGADEVHTTAEVRVCVELSLYVPTAASCSVFPDETLATNGVTAIDARVAGVAVIWVELLTPLSVEVIVAVPVARAVTNPALPPDVPTEATEVFDDVQVAEPVRSCVEPSV